MLKKIILFFLLNSFFIFFSYADINRKEIVSLNLDYYSLKTEQDRNKEKAKLEKDKIKEQNRIVSKKKFQERRERIKDFLKKLSKDIDVFFTAKSTYDDNIYRTNKDKTSAFINTLDIAMKYSPDFIFRRGHTYFGFDIHGGPDTNITKHGTFTKGKGMFNTYLMHKRGKYKGGLSFGLGKDYISLTELKTDVTRQSSFIDYYKRSYSAFFSTDWNRLPIDITYSHIDNLYEENYETSNTSSDIISLTNYYKIFPKTKLLSSFDYTVDNSPKRQNARVVTYTFWGGIKGKVSPKIDGLIKTGYKFGNPKQGYKVNTQTILASLDYRMSTRLFHTIEVERNLKTTAYETEICVKENGFRLYSTYLPPFSKKLRLKNSLSFTNYEYSSNREDNLYGLGIGAQYSLRDNLIFSTKYDFSYRDSEQKENSYKNNKVTIELTKIF